MAGRTIMEQIDELIAQGHLMERNSAHQHPRCATCKCLHYPGKERNTDIGPRRDNKTLCGFCVADDEVSAKTTWN